MPHDVLYIYIYSIHWMTSGNSELVDSRKGMRPRRCCALPVSGTPDRHVSRHLFIATSVVSCPATGKAQNLLQMKRNMAVGSSSRESSVRNSDVGRGKGRTWGVGSAFVASLSLRTSHHISIISYNPSTIREASVKAHLFLFVSCSIRLLTSPGVHPELSHLN